MPQYKFTLDAEFDEPQVIGFAKRKSWDGVSDLGEFVREEVQKFLVEQICGPDLEARLEAEAIIQSKEMAKQARAFVASKTLVSVKKLDDAAPSVKGFDEKSTTETTT